MSSIEAINVTTVPADFFTRTPAGESAILVTNGIIIHPHLAAIMPRTTHLYPLTSEDSSHVYSVTVIGYTVEAFIAIAAAFANKDIDLAESLIKALRPTEEMDW